MKNVVYSFHFYDPQKLTHQGVWDHPLGFRYPGVIDGVEWNKAMLEKTMAPVIDFQRRAKAPVYVGEFSAIRWAPEGSAHRWIKDCIEIFEAQGWHWSYHAFREWHGWSVEHSEMKEEELRANMQTSRERLLRHYFGKNRH